MYLGFPLEREEVEALATAFQSQLDLPPMRDGAVQDIALSLQGMPTNEKLRFACAKAHLLGMDETQMCNMLMLDVGLSERDMNFAYGWPVLHPDAMVGAAGEMVNAILPYTEADKTALLMNVLGMFGMTVPRHVFFYAGGQRHGGNLFWCIVGESKSGRKGTAHRMVWPVFEMFYPGWDEHIHYGDASGEGLINVVRDRREGEKVDKNGEVNLVVYDEGALHKNVLLVAEEFESTLITAKREGNTVSAVLRKAWDAGVLEVMTRTAPLRASDSHICLEGHVTPSGLRSRLSEDDMLNGFGNRFIWLMSRRSKSQATQDQRPDYERLASRVQRAWQFAMQQGEMRFDDEARLLYTSLYPALETELPGRVGALSSRAASIVCRLSMLYALLDCSPRIRVVHLKAAVALMRSCVNTLYYLFGDKTGNAATDDIVQHLRENPTGILRREMGSLVGALKRDQELLHTINDLKRFRLACATDIGTAREVWRPLQVYPFSFNAPMVGSADYERRATS